VLQNGQVLCKVKQWLIWRAHNLSNRIRHLDNEMSIDQDITEFRNIMVPPSLSACVHFG